MDKRILSSIYLDNAIGETFLRYTLFSFALVLQEIFSFQAIILFRIKLNLIKMKTLQ